MFRDNDMTMIFTISQYVFLKYDTFHSYKAFCFMLHSEHVLVAKVGSSIVLGSR